MAKKNQPRKETKAEREHRENVKGGLKDRAARREAEASRRREEVRDKIERETGERP